MLDIFISLITAIIISFKEANSDIELAQKLPINCLKQDDITQLYRLQLKKALIKNCFLAIIGFIFIEKLIDCIIASLSCSFFMKDALIDYATSILKDML